MRLIIRKDFTASHTHSLTNDQTQWGVPIWS